MVTFRKLDKYFLKQIAFLKHNDHGNDNYLFSHQAIDIGQMTLNLVIRSPTGHRTPSICINGQNLYMYIALLLTTLTKNLMLSDASTTLSPPSLLCYLNTQIKRRLYRINAIFGVIH